jgi:hypothetical protein
LVSIELRHNPFSNDSQAFFDGKLYQASSISKYLNSPFAAWADKIMECFSLEANDDYTLAYVGFEPYARILRHFADKESLCADFQTKPPMLGESVKSRLNKLSLLAQSGLSLKRTALDLVIYSDIESELIQEVSSKLPKYSFCKINVVAREMKLIDSDSDQSPTPCIVVSKDEPKPGKAKRQKETYWFQIGNENGFCGVNHHCFWEKTDTGAFCKLFGDYLEIGVLAPVLSDLLKTINVGKDAAAYGTLATLGRIEPIILVDVPASLEHGSAAKLRMSVLPAGSKAADVVFSSLNQAIVRVCGDSIEAVGTGETAIEAMHGQQLVGRFPIRTFRRVRARSIALNPGNLALAIGERARVRIEYEPKNADNIGLSKLSVSDSRVISVSRDNVDGFSVVALKEGVSSVVLRLDGIECGCAVKVSAKLERLELELSKKQFGTGEISRLTVRRVPENALAGEYKIQIVPSGIARHDIGVGALCGMRRGDGKVIVTDERARIAQTVEFRVV